MKKILLYLLLLSSFAASAQYSLNLPGGLRTLNGSPADRKYYNDAGTPYTNTAQVLSELTSGERGIGLTVIVGTTAPYTEYQFKDGIADVDLVAKGGGGGGVTTASSGLNLVGSDVRYGGALTSNTLLTGNFNLDFGNNANKLNNFRANATGNIGLTSGTYVYVESVGEIELLATDNANVSSSAGGINLSANSGTLTTSSEAVNILSTTDVVITTPEIDLNSASIKLSGLSGSPGQFFAANGTWATPAGGGGSGTVTNVSVTTANGVSGSVATATTTPAISLTLGAITPTSVAASGTVTGSNLSGTNTGDQTNITGNAATVTTNANLTGVITSVGNATSVASQTGTGSTFAMSVSPALTGTPTAPTATIGDKTTKVATTQFVSENTIKVYNVEAYGAKGDYKISSTASITSGTDVLTSSTSIFTASDVGKTIRVFGAGSAADLLTTIDGFTNATTISIATNASTTISAQKIEWGTDNTSLIQAAINAAFAAGGGTVYFPNGRYIVAGALVTSVDGVNPNAQIVVPLVTSSTGYRSSISLLGESPSPTNWGPLADLPQPTTGVQLISIINGTGTIPAVIGSSFYFDGFANSNTIIAKIENITIRVKTLSGVTHIAPVMTAFNLGYFSAKQVKNCYAYTESNPTFSVQPVAETYGFLLSTKAHDDMHSYYENLDASGYYYGFKVEEHDSWTRLNAWNCYAALAVKGNSNAHPILSGGTIGGWWCKYGVVFLSSCDVLITYSSERWPGSVGPSRWYDGIADIYYPSSVAIKGKFIGTVDNAGGTSTTLIQSGTNTGNLSIFDISTAEFFGKKTIKSLDGGSIGDAISITGNHTGRTSIVMQNTVAGSNASLYVQNNRGSFAAYGGMATWGSSAGGNIMGVPKSDLTALFADGASSSGLAVGTATAKSLYLATNNAVVGEFTSAGNLKVTSLDTDLTAPTTTGTTRTVVSDANGLLSFITTPTSGFANPMTTGGDVIYGGASGVATRLSNGTIGQVLTSSGGTTAPTWATPSGGGITNSAANNELMKSNGTNAIASGLGVTTTGNLDLGLSGTSGASRTSAAIGSATDIAHIIQSKGTGAVLLSSTSSVSGVSINFDNASATVMKGGSASASPIHFSISSAGGGGGELHSGNLTLATANGGGGGGGNNNAGSVALFTGAPSGSGSEGAVVIQSRSTGKLGFFNATAVVKQSAVTTTQGLANALTAYGLIPSSTISNELNTVKVTISSAELLALNTTPKPLIAAGGAGTIIDVVSIQYFLDYNSAAYTTNTDLYVSYNAAGANLNAGSLSLSGSLDVYAKVNLDSQTLYNSATRVNTPLVAYVATGNPSAGNGAVNIYITYRIVTL